MKRKWGKKLLGATLAAALLPLCGGAEANAIDFKIGGQWLMNFDVGQYRLLKETRNGTTRNKFTDDMFDAKQRIRLSVEAIASENLSATVQIQMGATTWGNADQGAALGADGKIVKVRWAYIDWRMPNTDLKTRMGIQYVAMPNKAGGTAIMGTRIAAILANYKINDNLGLTAMWGRPYNDNYPGEDKDGVKNYHQNYLDNLDLFALTVPITYDGFEATPWAMFGMLGKNTQWTVNAAGDPQLARYSTAGWTNYTLLPYPGVMARGDYTNSNTSKGYANLFWAGLPLGITALEPWSFELDLNYGYVGALGRYNAYKGATRPENLKRASTERQGWLAKALVEYKFDWGKPGVFGWYASGDDDNPKNGSERMPSLAAYGNFTSFLGDNPWSLGSWYDQSLDYAGTWGVGVQLKDLSFFVNDLKHTFRAAYWGGTNSPGMVKYMNNAYAWNDAWCKWDGPYLTTNDGLLEFNLLSNYKMYENFTVQMEWGYVANFIDNDTWKKAGNRNSSFQKQDSWKGQLKFVYSF